MKSKWSVNSFNLIIYKLTTKSSTKNVKSFMPNWFTTRATYFLLLTSMTSAARSTATPSPPLDGMLFHHRATPQHSVRLPQQFARIHL